MAQIGPFSVVTIFLVSCITLFKNIKIKKIQEICTKIGTRIFKIDQEMTEKIELKVGTPKKVKLKMGQFVPPQKFFLLFKDEIYPLFSYSYWSKVPK